MSTITAQDGQSIFDIVVEKFGSLEQLGDFLTDNPQLAVNDDLVSGQELEILSDNKGDEDVKAHFVKLNFVTNNKDSNFIPSSQDFKQFQDDDLFEFQDGDSFEFN